MDNNNTATSASAPIPKIFASSISLNKPANLQANSAKLSAIPAVKILVCLIFIIQF